MVQNLDDTRDLRSDCPAARSSARSRAQETSVILLAMRKLREAMVASQRCDNFAKDVYLFIIRTAILMDSFESYHHAVTYMLSVMHRRSALLSRKEHHELAIYRVLDLACRQADLPVAYAEKFDLRLQDAAVDNLLRALVHGSWTCFWRMREKADVIQRHLIKPAENRLRRHTAACLGRVYFTVELEFVERALSMGWDRLIGEFGIEWPINGDRIVVRRQKTL